jgi:hypothetical protein
MQERHCGVLDTNGDAMGGVVASVVACDLQDLKYSRLKCLLNLQLRAFSDGGRSGFNTAEADD